MLEIWKDERGFTLIEMIVVLILIAVLAAVAIPLYSDYRLQGIASEANSLVGASVSGADAFFQENGTYVGFGASNEFTTITARKKYFDYATSSETTTGIKIKATGNGTDAGITSADTLEATVSTTAATTWVAAGDCTAP